MMLYYYFLAQNTHRETWSVQSLYPYRRCNSYSLHLELFSFTNEKAPNHYVLLSDTVSAEFILVYSMQRLFTTFTIHFRSRTRKYLILVKCIIIYTLLGIVSAQIRSIISRIKMTCKADPPFARDYEIVILLMDILAIEIKQRISKAVGFCFLHFFLETKKRRRGWTPGRFCDATGALQLVS